MKMPRNIAFESKDKIFQFLTCLYVICSRLVLNNLKSRRSAFRSHFSLNLQIVANLRIKKLILYNYREIKMTTRHKIPSLG